VKITAQEEYGLRCLLELARHEGPDPLTVSVVAEHEGLSVPYVGKLMATLRQGGLVESVRGRSGGFVLTRPADQIAVGDALNALGGQFFEPHFCSTHHGASEECVHLHGCSIQTLWGVLGRIIDQVLTNTTIADLVNTTVPCESLHFSEEELNQMLGQRRRPKLEPAPATNPDGGSNPEETR
jgi:Rrf2 family protein